MVERTLMSTDLFDETGELRSPAGLGQVKRLTPDQRVKLLGQVRRSGHRRVVHQNRNHQDLPLERAEDLGSHPVLRIMEP
jgi:hypothetical protein